MRTMYSSIPAIPLLLISTLLFARCAFAQDLGRITPCAVSCILSSVDPGCANSDFACICASPEFRPVQCISSLCRPEDFRGAAVSVQDFCTEVGVGIDIALGDTPVFNTPGNTPTPNPTPVPSTANPSPTPETTPTPTFDPDPLPTPPPPSSTTSLDGVANPINGEPTGEPTGDPTAVASSGGSKLSTGAIAGIAVGVGVAVISLVVAAYMLTRMRGKGHASRGLLGSAEPGAPEFGGIGPDNDLPGQLVR
ncbi:hypothetical protein TWF730_005311 [Orbilia blumenaviensis]|uniref:CFEM domain-containing protein n=1 Tax=Orbilia blumenaviensis TaxID=1796055 RepID=A0AAV9VI08_9PEZI